MDEARILLRMPEVARRLGVARSTAYELARRGELPGLIRVGHSLRVSAKHLDAWVDAQGSKSAA